MDQDKVRIAMDESIAVPFSMDAFPSPTLHRELNRIIVKPGLRQKSGWLKRESPYFRPTNFHEDLPFFSDREGDNEVYIYLYDPAITIREELFRVRNLLLPGKRLYPYPVVKHRGYLAFILSYLLFLIQQNKKTDYNELFRQMDDLTSLMQMFIIGKGTAPFQTDNRRFAYPISFQKGTKEKKLSLFEYDLQKKKYRKRQKSDLFTLWEEIQRMQDEKSTLWIVEKGELNASPIWEQIRLSQPDIRWFTLDSSELPKNIPFLHILFAPRAFDPISFTK